MKKERININGIPAILWGDKSNQIVIVTHGSQSHKEDRFIQCCAENFCQRGFQLLSFDMPEHGDRKAKLPIHTVEQAIDDLNEIYHYSEERYESIIGIGCSLGAYYTLIAYQHKPLRYVALLSPVVDLIELTHQMLENDNKSINDVIENKSIILSNGIVVRYEDYQYLQSHLLNKVSYPISILYGRNDKLISYESIEKFVRKYDCEWIISDKSEHYFLTKEDMIQINEWLNRIK